ncbi:MAG: hypothetical protein AB8E15_00465 [Bdellovibrionales bacterium]
MGLNHKSILFATILALSGCLDPDQLTSVGSDSSNDISGPQKDKILDLENSGALPSNVYTGQELQVQWVDSDHFSDAIIEVYVSSSDSDACGSGTILRTGIEEKSSINQIKIVADGLFSGTNYICIKATYNDGQILTSTSDAFTFTESCTWISKSDTDWGTKENWMGCTSDTPGSSDSVRFNSGTVNPLVNGNFAIAGFEENPGISSEIVISSGSSLSIADENAFQSDISFSGDSSTCANCKLILENERPKISRDSSLHLKSGIVMELAADDSILYVGDSSEAGHLIATSGTLDTEKPKITAGSSGDFHGLVLRGPDSKNSSINLDGLIIDSTRSYSPIRTGLSIFQNSTIKKMDRVVLPGGYSRAVVFNDCTNLVLEDDFWTQLSFSKLRNILYRDDSFKRGVHFEMSDASCSGAPTFAVSDYIGPGWGSFLEIDNFNKIVWNNDIAHTCTWNGTTSTDFFNPANWSNCANNRGGYPDSSDMIIIPSSPTNQPYLDRDWIVKGIASGSGGGTISVDSVRLHVYSNSIESLVNFKAATATCTNCYVYMNTPTLINGGGIGLIDGIHLSTEGQLLVGNSASGGIFNTSTSLATSDSAWPMLSDFRGYFTGIVVEGSSANKSSVNIDGLRILDLYGNFSYVNFKSNFELNNLDKIQFGQVYDSWNISKGYITIDTCSNSTIGDLEWTDLEFQNGIGSSAHSVSISNCSSMGTDAISLSKRSSGDHSGFLSTKENDTDGILKWNVFGATIPISGGGGIGGFDVSPMPGGAAF